MSAARTRLIPETSTAAKSIRAPKAIAARIASLCAASTPFDVESRVGLGVAQRLRLGENLAEVAPGRFHRREDVIAGAVEDAVNPLDPVRGGAFAQPLDHRDAARHRGLELERRRRWRSASSANSSP